MVDQNERILYDHYSCERYWENDVTTKSELNGLVLAYEELWCYIYNYVDLSSCLYVCQSCSLSLWGLLPQPVLIPSVYFPSFQFDL